MSATDEDRPTAPQLEDGILERWPSWSWLAILGGIVVFVWILTLINREIFFDNFVDPFWWQPIIGDEGYNLFNTAALILPLLFVLLWAYGLLLELGERVDFGLILGALPFLVLGSVYRVLEDADLFAPYGTRNACVPDAAGGFFETCFGIIFITPIIYVLTAFLAAGFLWLGHVAKRIATRQTVAKGLQFHAGVLIVLVLLSAAMWKAEPVAIRYGQEPWWVLMAALPCYVISHRHASSTGRIEPRIHMFSYGLFVLLFGVLYVLDWMTGGHWGRGPTAGDVRAWVWLALLLAPLLVMVGSLALGRILSNRRPFGDARPVHPAGETAKQPIPLTYLLGGVLLVITAAAFISLIGASDLEATIARDGPVRDYALSTAKILVGPAVLAAGVVFTMWIVRDRLATHPHLIYFAGPINLVMVFGQMADALMTALGIDLYGYSEKHVLPAFLIETVANANLPFGMSNWPTAIVMLPLKLAIVLLVIWVIDVSVREPRQNLIGLIKLAIIMVGLSPAIRNATRLAMGT